jgi:cytochrome d ubiquinol oxidase subunit I
MAKIYIHKVRSVFSATAVLLMGVLLLLALTEGEDRLLQRRLVYALVGGLMLGQVTWCLNYWQATGWTGVARLSHWRPFGHASVVLTNPVALAAFPHTIAACFMVSSGLVISAAAWHLARNQHVDTMRPALKFGLWTMVGAGAITTFFGDQLSLAMVATQPMKMAAAEATYDTVCGADASFSLFTLGTPDGATELFSIRVPYLLALLSTHTLEGCVEGINDLQALYADLYGPGDYAPIIWITYWSFRWMIGLGMLHVLIAVIGLWLTRGGRMPRQRWVWTVAIWSFPLSLLAMIVGWIFTEMGRQPWIVFSLLPTESAVSPNVTGLEVLISLVAFTLIYGALAVVEVRLILRAIRTGPPEIAPADPETGKVEHAATVY